MLLGAASSASAPPTRVSAHTRTAACPGRTRSLRVRREAGERAHACFCCRHARSASRTWRAPVSLRLQEP